MNLAAFGRLSVIATGSLVCLANVAWRTELAGQGWLSPVISHQPVIIRLFDVLREPFQGSRGYGQ